jgi:glycosyltransferase involved in cell wall biosynthesis
VVVPVNARRRFEWALGEQIILPRFAARASVDLVHSLANTAPARGRFARVVTVHDLLYARLPSMVPRLMRTGTRALVGVAARRSDRVITLSQSSAEDLRRVLGVPDERIDVVPNGVAPPRERATQPDVLRARYGLGDRRYLLATGLRLPHKNFERLLAALASIEPFARPVVVITGNVASGEDPLAPLARTLDIESDVRLLAWLPAEDLEGLYADAAGFVHPSLFEGFGLPVLEAMIRGVPVACSDIPALREVAESSALTFDPHDPLKIARAMRALLDDPALVARLREAGSRRASVYTWEAAALGTVAAYERALSEGRT